MLKNLKIVLIILYMIVIYLFILKIFFKTRQIYSVVVVLVVLQYDNFQADIGEQCSKKKKTFLKENLQK